jgi:DNA-binding NarL/FixJ family response regulator
MPTTVLVADDHALFRDGLQALIGRWEDSARTSTRRCAAARTAT